MTTASTPSLLGRTDDLADIAAALDAAAAGTLRVVLVEGEPGIGKTELVRAVIGSRSAAPFVVQHGVGHELERERPFGVVADALELTARADDPDRRAIASLLTAHDTGTAATSEAANAAATADTADTAAADGFAAVRYHLVEAIVDLIDRTTAERGLLLVLEDLHWADPSSLLVVAQLARRLTRRPVAVIGTFRPSPDAQWLGSLQRELSGDSVIRIRPRPLTVDEVDQVATTTLGAPPAATLRAVLGKAGGNPFFVHELLAALADDGSIVIRDGAADVPGPQPPASLRVTILRRLGFLGSERLAVLRTASVLGSRFTMRDLSTVLQVPANELVALLDAPRLTGLIVDAGTALEFRHDLVRDAIYEDLPLSARQALHLQAARRLAADGRDPVEVAPHYLAGSPHGDPDAIAWLQRAAADALSRAPSSAADLLTAAVELCGADDPMREQLLAELATALTWSGQVDRAEDLLSELVDRPLTTAADDRLRLGLARVLLIQGKAHAAAEQCDELRASGQLTGLHHARALTDAATARLLSGDIEGARRDAEQALALGQEEDDDPAVCGALAALTWVTNLSGRTTEALDIGQRAVELAESSAVRETARRYPHCYVGSVLMDADRFDDGMRMYDVGRRLAEAFGDAWQLPIHHWGAVLGSFYRGRFDDTLTALQTATEVVDEVGTQMLVVWTHAVAAHVAIRRDELGEASVSLAEADEQVARLGPGIGFDWLLWARARLLDAESDTAAATATLRSAWDLAAALGILSQRRLIGPDLARLLIATGDRGGAAEVAASMARVAEVSGVAGARAAALRCEGLATADADLVLQAVAIHRDGPRRMELADACVDAGQLLGAVGREGEAATLLDEAAAHYRDAGAVRDERVVDAALRELGISRGRRGSRDRPKLGWESLTPTELEVTRLAADGLTNPQIGQRMFISPRTVETHLSHVYGKLGLSSRVELAALAAKRAS